VATTLTTGVAVSVTPQLVAALGNFAPQLANFGLTFQTGTSANQADRCYVAQRSASTGGDTMDLSGGGLLQPDQSSFSIVELCVMLIINRDASINITVGGGSNAVIVVGNPISPGGFDLIVRKADPAIAVANGSTDNLKVVSASGTPLYDVVLIGRSA